MDDERDFYMDFVEYILSLPDDISKRITTLGIRTYPGNQQFTPLGIWSCNWIPNIKRLYVDSSLLPPFGQGSSAEEMLASMESGAPSSKPRAVPGLFIDFSNGPCSVETFAFVGSGMMGHFGHLEGLYGQRQYIQNTFVKIKRIYLFTSPWQQDGSEMHRQVDKVVEDFDAVTNVQLIVNIVIQGVEPRSWCPVEASVSALPNGTMWIQNVEIDQPQAPQDMLALMHHVVDDIEAEWAQDEFQGYRWKPLSRPRYVSAIPTRYTLNKHGVKLPQRMK